MVNNRGRRKRGGRRGRARAQATPLYSENLCFVEGPPMLGELLSPAMPHYFYSPSTWQNQGMLQPHFNSIDHQEGFPMPIMATGFTDPLQWGYQLQSAPGPYPLQNQSCVYVPQPIVLGESGTVAQDHGFGQGPTMPQLDNPIPRQNQLLQEAPEHQGNLSDASPPPLGLQQPREQQPDLSASDAGAIHGPAGTDAALTDPRTEESAPEDIDSSQTRPISDVLSEAGHNLVAADAWEKAKRKKERRDKAEEKREAIFRKQVREEVMEEQERLRLEVQQMKQELERLREEVKNLSLRQDK